MSIILNAQVVFLTIFTLVSIRLLTTSQPGVLFFPLVGVSLLCNLELISNLAISLVIIVYIQAK